MYTNPPHKAASRYTPAKERHGSGHSGLPGLLGLLLCLNGTLASAAGNTLTYETDPHRNPAGFFDIHVCHWPDRPLFFMALFSTEQFNKVKSVQVSDPDGKVIGMLDMNKFRLVVKKGKPEKRVFIRQFPVPRGARDGWYRAQVTLTDGTRYKASDYVILGSMGLATGVQPANEEEVARIPKTLKWKPISGARYYKVFIRDEWAGKLLYESDLVSKPELKVPDGLLQPGGYYSWRVHARDMNENILLGDFDYGSLSKPTTFSISDTATATAAR
jgi:hypothetical protein